jgi:hypothetical protein
MYEHVEHDANLNSDAFCMYFVHVLGTEPGQIEVESLHKRKEHDVDKLFILKFIFIVIEGLCRGRNFA